MPAPAVPYPWQVLFARQKPHRSTESNDDWKAVMKVGAGYSWASRCAAALCVRSQALPTMLTAPLPHPPIPQSMVLPFALPWEGWKHKASLAAC